MNSNRLHIIFPWLSFSLTLLLILALFGNFSPSDYRYFFSSDTLYLPSIYQDLFIDGNSIKGWELNPAPNIFPDMIAYFAIMALSGEDFMRASLIYAVLQYFIILLLLFKIARFHLSRKQALNYLGMLSLLLSLFFLNYFEEDRLQLSFQLLSNSYHLGAFVNTLLAVYFTLLYILKSKKLALPTLLVLVLFAGFSDKLFIAQFIGLGFISFLFAFLINRKIITRKIYWLLLGSIFSSVLSVFLISLVPEDFVTFGTPYSSGSPWEQSIFSIEKQISHFHEILTSSLSGFFIISFLAIAIIGLTLIVLKNRKLQNNLFWISGVLLVYILGALFLPAVTGSYIGTDCIRYNISAYIIAFASIPLIFVYFKNEIGLKILASLGIITISATVILSFPSLINTKHFSNHYPKDTETLDSLKIEYQLKNGISEYWYAKLNTLYSKENIRIYSAHYSLWPYFHVTNSNWFFKNSDGSQAVFNFIVVENEIKIEAIVKIFENYQLVTKNGLTICITPDFVFDPETKAPTLLTH